MSKIEFIYEGKPTIIQAESNENMNSIVQKFYNKSGTKELSDSMCFLYSGSQILSNSNSSFKEIANKADKERNQMTIIVNKYKNEEENKLIKSKKVICPICKEICKLYIYNYKISLYDCKNNHKSSNIFFKDFDSSQQIDETKIICENCKMENITNTYQKSFYICRTCNQNICPICKQRHHNNQSHICVEYSQKDNICMKHNRLFISYCNSCKTDICMTCERDHYYHDIITYGALLLSNELLKSTINELNENINKLKNNSGEIKEEKINDFLKNLEIYYNISKFIIDSLDDKNLNFFILNNLNFIHQNNKLIIDNIKKINNETNMENKTKIILDIYNKMSTKEENENDIDKIYPEGYHFLYPELNEGSEYFHTYQNWFYHWPHGWHFHHGPYPHGHHGHHGPHGPHEPHHPHGFPHGPINFNPPHGPHEFHEPQGPNDPNVPHGPHIFHGHGPHFIFGPHGLHGPHGPRGFFFPHPHHFGPHVPHEPGKNDINSTENQK